MNGHVGAHFSLSPSLPATTAAQCWERIIPTEPVIGVSITTPDQISNTSPFSSFCRQTVTSVSPAGGNSRCARMIGLRWLTVISMFPRSAWGDIVGSLCEMPPRGWRKVVRVAPIVAVTTTGALDHLKVPDGPRNSYRKVCAAEYSDCSMLG